MIWLIMNYFDDVIRLCAFLINFLLLSVVFLDYLDFFVSYPY